MVDRIEPSRIEANVITAALLTLDRRGLLLRLTMASTKIRRTAFGLLDQISTIQPLHWLSRQVSSSSKIS